MINFGGKVLVGLAGANPLLDGLGFGVRFHADTLQKAQHSFGPASRTTGWTSKSIWDWQSIQLASQKM
jgi:hypothetical protein